MAVLYHPRFIASLNSVSINNVWVFVSGLLSSAGGNLTTLWTGATTNGGFPSSPNHSAIPHSAGQLPLPLPTAALPNFSSWLKGPTQVLSCLGLLSQDLFGFKGQLQAIRPALHSAFFTPQTLHMLNQHLFPLFLEAEDLYLSFRRIILLTVLAKPLNFSQISLHTFPSSLSYIISLVLLPPLPWPLNLQVSPTYKNINKTPQSTLIWGFPCRFFAEGAFRVSTILNAKS